MTSTGTATDVADRAHDRRPTPVVGHHRTVPPPDPSTNRVESAFDWCFRSRETGQVTIAQFPNIALGIFLASVVAGWLVPQGTTAHRIVEWIGVAALGWWAADELIRGVNPWRRLLGVSGLVLTVGGVVRLLSAG
jgi:hypothetical protein